MAPSAERRSLLGAEARETYESRGCGECRGTGFHGRTGIYELLVPDDELRAAVIEHRSAGHLRRLGLAKGMRTLQDDGLRLACAGITTVEEVFWVADVGGEQGSYR